MNTFVSLPPVTVDARRHPMRTRLLIFFMALAVLWCGTGGPALACVGESPVNIQAAIGAVDQLAAKADGEPDKPASVPRQAVAHHHCCMATPTTPAPILAIASPKNAPVFPAGTAPLRSYAQAPPVQPPSA